MKTYEPNFKIGECIVGQVQMIVNGEAQYRYVICNAKKFRYRRFLGVRGFNAHYYHGVFLSANKYNVSENTTVMNCNGSTLQCFPEYDEPLGTSLVNIFDESEQCLLGSNDNYMAECTEVDYSSVRPFFYRITGQPLKWHLSSNLKFDKTIPFSHVLTIAHRMDILTMGSFTAKDVSDILLMITNDPENFGFTQEQITTNEAKDKSKVLML